MVGLWVFHAVPVLGAAAPGAYLVRDINDTPIVASSFPTSLTPFANGAVFLASTPATGQEPWFTDGTAAGTAPLPEVVPGPASANVRWILAIDQRLFLLGDAVRQGRPFGDTALRLWRSDRLGAPHLVKTIDGFDPSSSRNLLALRGRALFFTYDPATLTTTLWRSDGTARGTVAIHRFADAGEPFEPSPVIVGDWLLFVGHDAAHGRELWRSDGTSGGTRLIRDLAPGPGSGAPSEPPVAIGRVAYFSGFDAASGTGALWRSDGSAAGTRIVTEDFGDVPRSAAPSQLTPLDGALYFTLPSTAAAPGSALWRSDGSAAGTAPIRDIEYPYYLVSGIGHLFFLTARRENDGVRLWASDGTDGGTVAIADGRFPGFQPPVAAGGRLYFPLDDAEGRRVLWSSDGSPAGTAPLLVGQAGDYPAALGAVGDTVLLSSGANAAIGSELWVTDGTAAGTVALRNLAPDDVATEDASPEWLTPFAGELAFVAWARGARGVWLSDGTAAGTRAVGSARSVAQLVAADDALFFRADGMLWRSDGGDQGTHPIPTDETVAELVPAGTTLLYRDDTTLVRYASDGNVPLASIVDVRDATSVGGMLFFVAAPADRPQNRELWVSDGTAAGTRMVDLRPGDRGADPGPLVAGRDRVYFAADDGRHGRNLWTSDGSLAGTTLVKDVLGDAGGFLSVSDLVSVPPHLFFTVGADSWWQLWVSDGTAGGTLPVRDFEGPPRLARAGGRAFLAASDRAVGLELWTSDGTPGGTALVADINPGAPWSSPWPLADAGGRLAFQACEDGAGCEIWLSDGSAATTIRAGDIAAGPASADVRSCAATDALLFCSANDQVHGSELWAIPLSTPASCPGDCDANGRTSIDEVVVAIEALLGRRAVAACRAADGDHDGVLSVDEVVRSLRSALRGCPLRDR